MCERDILNVKEASKKGNSGKKDSGKETSGKFSSPIPDETDRKIMRALSDELSDITVSRELFERTLFAVQKKGRENAGSPDVSLAQGGAPARSVQDSGAEGKSAPNGRGTNRTARSVQDSGAKRKKRWGYRVMGGIFTAAAAVLVVALGFEIAHNGGRFGKGAQENMTLSGGAPNAAKPAQNDTEDPHLNSAAQDGKGEGSSEPADEPSWDGIMSVEDDFMKEDSQMPWEDGMNAGGSDFWEDPASEPEQSGEWLRGELLAAFGTQKEVGTQEEGEALPEADAGDGAQSVPPEETAGAAEADVRYLSWQWEGTVLSCVIYGEDYRIVATLQEEGGTRRIELTDWVYAPQLWEMAEE